MPIMELVDRQLYQNQEVINRYNFIANGTPASVSLSFALVYAFGAILDNTGNYPTSGLFEYVRDVQAAAITHTEIQARDMYSVTDFYTRPFLSPPGGNNAGGGASPFEALGFKSNRVRSDVSRGYKRYAGIPPAFIGDGGLLQGGGISVGALLATKLGDILEYDDEGNTITFTPCVLGLDMYTSPPARKAYRPYATETEQLAHTAVGVVWGTYDRIRSQVSRQVGHGR